MQKKILNNRNKAIKKAVIKRLARGIKELEERYAEPLPQIEREVETYAAKVAEHLQKMGVELP